MNPSPPEQWTPKDIVLFLAVKAMGWLKAYVVERGCDEEPDNIGVRCPVYWPCGDRMPWNPLTSGDDRDMLVEAMRKKGWVTSLENGRSASDGSCSQNWWVSTLVKIAHCRTQTAHALADTPHRAVCTAAIKALLAKETQNG